MLGQQVRYHRPARRAGDVAEQPDDHGQRIESAQTSDEAHRQIAERAEHQPEQNHASATETVGQRAAQHVARETGSGKEREEDSGLGHPDPEAVGDVQREERIEDGPADGVDERRAHQDPESAGVLMVG